MSCKLELELCGYVKDNCTEALKTCDFDCSDGEIGWLNIALLIAIALGIYYYCFYKPRKKKEKANRNYSAVQQAQVVAVRPTLPVIQGRFLPEQSANKYSNKFTSEDLDEFNKVITGQQDYMTTHDGVIIDKDLTIAGRTRGSALNQPTVF